MKTLKVPNSRYFRAGFLMVSQCISTSTSLHRLPCLAGLSVMSFPSIASRKMICRQICRSNQARHATAIPALTDALRIWGQPLLFKRARSGLGNAILLLPMHAFISRIFPTQLSVPISSSSRAALSHPFIPFILLASFLHLLPFSISVLILTRTILSARSAILS
jgi:hypothetical protein